MKKSIVVMGLFAFLFCLSSTNAMNMEWVYVNDPGVSGHEGFSGYMSKYETTNAQYCEFLNAALASEDITVSGNSVLGANGSNSGADYVGQVYYNLAGAGYTYYGATNGGAACINWTGSAFNVDPGFENHPVTYVSWYGAMAFCNYYGYRLPTEWEWQAVADYDGSYTYGCGTSIDPSIANYDSSNHPYGTIVVGSIGDSSGYGYGMHDMSGNIWEWTSSVEITNSRMVIRGGAWTSTSLDCTVTGDLNDDDVPDYTQYNRGFRVCLGLIAHYKLDDTSGAVIDETGNHNGTNYGATRGITGTEGKAYQFDGSDYISTDILPPIHATASMWIYPKVNCGFMGTGDTSSCCKDTWSFSYNVDNKMISLDFYKANNVIGAINTPNGSVPANQWSLVTATVNDTYVSIYVNGILSVTGVLSSSPDTHDRGLMIGQHYMSGGGVYPLQGKMDDVRIYDCALNEEEIQALYELSFTDYHVDTNHGNNSNDGLSRETAFATVQHGIDQSDDLDTISVWPGIYSESVDFLGKAITVESAEDAAVITWPAGYGVRFHTAEDINSMLKNIVIRDCLIGIQAESSSPAIEHVTVVNNTQGIVADGVAEPNITNTIVWGNTSDGLIDCDASFSWIQDKLANSIDGLIAYYPFDGNADDASGNSYNGTVNGAISTAGKCDGAMSFDGLNDYVDTIPQANIPSVMSMSMWVYLNPNLNPPDNCQSDHIWGTIENASGGKNGYFVSYTVHDKNLVFGYYSNNVLRGEVFTENNLLLYNTWTFLTFTVDGLNNVKIYVNGEEKGSGNFSVSPTSHDRALMLGKGMRQTIQNYFFEGKMDDVSIYNRALSESEIQQQYGRGNSGYGAGDPVFVNPSTNDYHLKSEDGRFFAVPASDPNMFGVGIDGAWVMDLVTSPCIDGGNPENNPSAEKMPNGGRVNMGAYGGTAYASKSEYPLQGDINRDGIVNMADMAILSMDWLKSLAWFE